MGRLTFLGTLLVWCLFSSSFKCQSSGCFWIPNKVVWVEISSSCNVVFCFKTVTMNIIVISFVIMNTMLSFFGGIGYVYYTHSEVTPLITKQFLGFIHGTGIIDNFMFLNRLIFRTASPAVLWFDSSTLLIKVFWRCHPAKGQAW